MKNQEKNLAYYVTNVSGAFLQKGVMTKNGINPDHYVTLKNGRWATYFHSPEEAIDYMKKNNPHVKKYRVIDADFKIYVQNGNILENPIIQLPTINAFFG